jgi:hypothetical protein
MGNRANFGFTDGQDILYLYGHWAGEPGMKERFAGALRKAEPRWSDHGYATRIATSHLIGDDADQELGWGFYINRLHDNENPVLVVDWSAQKVTQYPNDLADLFMLEYDKPEHEWTLSEFVEAFGRVSA